MSEERPWEHAHEWAAPMAAGATGPLKGIRVIDLTRALAGPFCGMWLADLGADVIKVEPPEGDIARYSAPFTPEDTLHEYGGYFASTNRNKRGVMLDLRHEEAREQLRTLIDGADAVIENFRAGVMERLELSYESLSARNPKLVYAAIRGYGDPRTGDSPYMEWPSYDIVAQAMGGVASMTGTADGQPLKAGPSIGDLFPGTVAALGVVAALMHAKATGEGQFVDVSMYDAMIALCEAVVYRYSYQGIVTKPLGNSHAQLTPFDIYPTADGHCAIAAPTANHWAMLVALMDRVDLIEDLRTRSNTDRIANADFVREVMTEWTTRHTTAELLAILAGSVPVGPVNDAAAIFADPHVRAREVLVAVEQPGSARPVVLPNSVIRMTKTPPGVYRRPPKLGEHNDELLR